MLAAHEPFDDPRVDWVARSASELYDTTILGLHNYDGVRPDLERAGAYRIKRVHRDKRLDAYFLDHLLSAAVERALKPVSGINRFAFVLLLIVFLPMELLARFCVQAAVGLWSFIRAMRRLILGLLPRAVLRLVKRQLRAQNILQAHLGPSLALDINSAMSSTPTEALAATSPGYWARARMFLWTLQHVFGTAQVFWRTFSVSGIQPAVVYCNDLDTLLPGALISVTTGAKLVYDSHEYWPYSNVEALPIHVWFFRHFERALIWRADVVITISDLLAHTLETAYRVSKVHSIPNAEPWTERGPINPDAGELARLGAGRVRFLFQGSFAPQRGLEELVEAWAKVDGTMAVLFLRGPDNAWRQALARRAQQLGLLGTAVFVLPPVSVDELVAGAGEADVGIIPYKPDFPAYRYACPNKLSQYMHAGLAILSNAIPYVAQQVHAARCGLTYDSHDPSSITAAVMRMAEDPAALAAMKSNASEYGRTVFNWQVQAARLPELIRTPATQAQGQIVA